MRDGQLSFMAPDMADELGGLILKGLKPYGITLLPYVVG